MKAFKEQQKILKHGMTSWLSLGKCLNYLIEQWQVLLFFFKEEYSPDTSVTANSKRKLSELDKATSSKQKLDSSKIKKLKTSSEELH